MARGRLGCDGCATWGEFASDKAGGGGRGGVLSKPGSCLQSRRSEVVMRGDVGGGNRRSDFQTRTKARFEFFPSQIYALVVAGEGQYCSIG